MLLFHNTTFRFTLKGVFQASRSREAVSIWCANGIGFVARLRHHDVQISFGRVWAMARLKSDAVLVAKLEEAKRLDEEIRRLKNQARDRQRAEDEQRQKLVGRVVLGELKAKPDGELGKLVMALLAAKLTRASERALFPDLPLIDAPSPAGDIGEAAVTTHAGGGRP